MKQLPAYVRPYARGLLAGALLVLVGGVGALAQPMVAKYLLDALARGDSIAGWLLALAGLLIGATGASAAGVYLITRTGEDVVQSARRGLVMRLLRLRLSAVDSVQPGDLSARVTGDTTQLRAAVTTNLVDLAVGGFQLLGIVAMAYLDSVLRRWASVINGPAEARQAARRQGRSLRLISPGLSCAKQTWRWTRVVDLES